MERLCARCGKTATAERDGHAMCASCAEQWEDFKIGLEVARRIQGLGKVAVRLPSGRTYRPTKRSQEVDHGKRDA